MTMRSRRISPQQLAEHCIRSGDCRRDLFQVKFINDRKGKFLIILHIFHKRNSCVLHFRQLNMFHPQDNGDLGIHLNYCVP